MRIRGDEVPTAMALFMAGRTTTLSASQIKSVATISLTHHAISAGCFFVGLRSI
jgi:hypothetical protein